MVSNTRAGRRIGIYDRDPRRVEPALGGTVVDDEAIASALRQPSRAAAARSG